MNVNSTIAVYPNHSDAEAAVKELQSTGFDMKKLSIVGCDYQTDQHVVGYYNIDERMKFWGKTGAFWGGIWGLLVGSGFFFIPGLGPLLVAGPLVTAIVAALEGAVVVGAASAAGAGLFAFGIPENSILRYETALKAGKFVLLASGTPEEAKKAKEILSHGKPESLELHPVLADKPKNSP